MLCYVSNNNDKVEINLINFTDLGIGLLLDDYQQFDTIAVGNSQLRCGRPFST